MNIPFNKPCVTGNEENYLKQKDAIKRIIRKAIKDAQNDPEYIKMIENEIDPIFLELKMDHLLDYRDKLKPSHYKTLLELATGKEILYYQDSVMDYTEMLKDYLIEDFRPLFRRYKFYGKWEKRGTFESHVDTLILNFLQQKPKALDNIRNELLYEDFIPFLDKVTDNPDCLTYFYISKIRTDDPLELDSKTK